MTLPTPLSDWFTAKGWSPHPHQLALLDRAQEPSTLLIAPTGGGKTLAGFLPTLAELLDAPGPGLHTLYISPLKALASDIRRNLETPVSEIGLDIRIEDRTGDTRQADKKRQRVDPPHILLTTPESLALLLSYEEAPRIFASLSRVIVDEIHALAESKRGDQLMLNLARLQTLAPDLRRVGLSATVEAPAALARFLDPTGTEIFHADPGPTPDIAMLRTATPPPWAGTGGRYAVREIMAEIEAANITLIFINTRATAELFFQELWKVNDNDLPIALHHGSLARDARERVEAAMVAGTVRAVVCTGTLDLGIDWGDVDLVIQVGAPKNVKRLVQRIGRSNHRYNAPSRALIVPANRFEVVECVAALEAVRDADLDGDPRADAPLDVLCQHIIVTACAGPFDAGALFEEVRLAGPYCNLTRADFDACVEYAATGGYALRAYDRWQRLIQQPDGRWQLRDPRRAALVRMNSGTIVDTETLSVRMRGSNRGVLGEVEEAFAATLTPGDTFLIGGQVVEYKGMREMTLMVTKTPRRDPKIAVFGGSKFSTSTQLSHRLLALLNDRSRWSALPAHTRKWLDQQVGLSTLPSAERILVESFWRGDRAYTCIYGFAGRNAMQTLGLLVSKRMEEAGLDPIGFVATDYALLIWGLEAVKDPAALLEPVGLRDGLETWLRGNAVMKKTFSRVASVAMLLEKNFPGKRKSGKQALFSSDILYDTLMKYDPDHLMMRITRDEADSGLVDFGRIEEMLTRTGGRIEHRETPHVTPLAAPLLLEAGKIPIRGLAEERLLEEDAARMMEEAGLDG